MTTGRGPVKGLGEVRILECCLFATTILMFQDEAPLLRAHAHPAIADTWPAAVNLVVVESDGSRPDRPDYLGGGGQARRHRAACNRGHGLLRGCVECRIERNATRTSGPAIIAGRRMAHKPVQVHAL